MSANGGGTDDPKPEEYVDITPESVSRVKGLVSFLDGSSLLTKIITLVVLLAPTPWCARWTTTVVTESQEREAQANRKSAERKLAVQKEKELQTGILVKILDILKDSDITQPSDVYRLSVLTAMINENPKTFGIVCVDTGDLLKETLKKIRPFENLRSRLATTKNAIEKLSADLKESSKVEETLKSQLAAAQKRYGKARWRGIAIRERWAKEVAEKESALAKHQAQQTLLKKLLEQARERNTEYEKALKSLAARLKAQTAASAREQALMRQHVSTMRNIAYHFSRKSKESKAEAKKLEKILKKVNVAYQKAQTTISTLQSELKDLRDSEAQLKVKLKSAEAKLLQHTSQTAAGAQ
jgi:DNA repair exonuclease SbcCD ATPase subunit